MILNDFTQSQPARLEISFSNSTNRPVSLGGHELLPFSEPEGIHDQTDARLLLVPDDHNWLTPTDDDGTPVDSAMIPDAPSVECWTVGYENVATTLTTMLQEIPSGENISHQYSILDWNNDSCLPPGSYSFNQDQRVFAGGIENRGPELSITLGFAIHIESNHALSIAVREPSIEPQ